MDVFSVSVVFDSALVQVLANVEIASVQLAETQKTPEIEPKTLALHTRALNAQVAALKHLTVLLEKLTRLAASPANAAGAAPPAPEAPAPGDLGADWGALQSEIPEFLKNISPPAAPPQPPAPNSQPPFPNPQPPTANSPALQPNPQPLSPVSPSPTQNSELRTQNSLSSAPPVAQPHGDHPSSPTPISQPPIPSASVPSGSAVVNNPLTSPPPPASDGRIR